MDDDAERITGDAAGGESALCTQCGLCCTGSVFTHLDLKDGEVEPARAIGMDVFLRDEKQSKHAAGQPCPLQSFPSCTAYAGWRPSTCCNYRCRVLVAVESSEKTVKEAEATISKAVGMYVELTELARRLGLIGKDGSLRRALFEFQKLSAQRIATDGYHEGELDFARLACRFLQHIDKHFDKSSLVGPYILLLAAGEKHAAAKSPDRE